MENSYEVDANILKNPTVWDASRHLAGFTDHLQELFRQRDDMPTHSEVRVKM